MNRYFYLLRPPCYGCQPDGFANRQGGLPKRYWPTEAGDTIDAFGFVEYPEPLSFTQVWKFDLLPDNPLEQGRYRLWLCADRNEKYAAELEADFIALPDVQLIEAAKYDPVSYAALMIKRALSGAKP